MVYFINAVALPLLNKKKGAVERKQRHLLEVARVLYFQANLPFNLLGGMCSHHCLYN